MLHVYMAEAMSCMVWLALDRVIPIASDQVESIRQSELSMRNGIACSW